MFSWLRSRSSAFNSKPEEPEQQSFVPLFFDREVVNVELARPMVEVATKATSLTIGIGITTYNRSAMLERCIDAVRAHTTNPHILFVADDGSQDDTEAMLQRKEVAYVSASNRNIAWNKNRALYYLKEVRSCDVIILLEDDTYPNENNWEQKWIEAAVRYGHMNLAPSHWRETYLSGDGSVVAPFVSQMMTGQCVSFSATALSRVGYMDTRFQRYGFEHADHSNRLIDNGFGGLPQADGRKLPYLITSSLIVEGLDKAPDYAGIEQNAPVFTLSQAEPWYRNAWRGNEEQAILRAEMMAAVDPNWRGVPSGDPDWLLSCFDHAPLLFDATNRRMSAAAETDACLRVGARVCGRTVRLFVISHSGVCDWIEMRYGFDVDFTADHGHATVFEFVSVAGAGFGLRADGFYLCCEVEQDRVVGLVRPGLDKWETLHFRRYVLPTFLPL